jgi:hypothetical protein
MVLKSSPLPQCTHGAVTVSPNIASIQALRLRRSAALPRLSPPFLIFHLLSLSGFLLCEQMLAGARDSRNITPPRSQLSTVLSGKQLIKLILRSHHITVLNGKQ